MSSPTEALIALLIVMVILIGVVIVILIYAIKQMKDDNQEHALKIRVIVDSLIELMQNKYGQDEEERE